MKKFNHRNRKSPRHPYWDYGRAAAYFVTICTQDRVHYFGEIENGIMCLNPLGTMAHQEWYKTLEIRPDMNLELGEFVVMPNHVHGIIIIGENEYNMDAHRDGGGRDAMHFVPTTTVPINQFGPQRKNLSSIIRGYKSAVTQFARKNDIEFQWQSRYHDHIIRDAASFGRISNYIINNPLNWDKDKFHE